MITGHRKRDGTGTIKDAILDGAWILMHVSTSGIETSGGIHGFVGREELRVSDLNGWVIGVGFHCDSLGSCGFSYDDVQNLILCP